MKLGPGQQKGFPCPKETKVLAHIWNETVNVNGKTGAIFIPETLQPDQTLKPSTRPNYTTQPLP